VPPGQNTSALSSECNVFSTVTLLGVSRVITLRRMLAPLLIFALVGCMGLFAALRPEAYTVTSWQNSSAEQCLATLRRYRSQAGLFFVAALAMVIALPFQSKWSLFAPVFRPLFFLVCAVAYVWWGVRLLRNPESFLKQTTEPWSRLPTWAVQCFGALLLLGAAGFSFGFALRIKGLLR
jgi:hypothetical protein